MKRLVCLIVLVLSAFTLTACAGTSMTYTDAPSGASPSEALPGQESTAEASPPIPAVSGGGGTALQNSAAPGSDTAPDNTATTGNGVPSDNEAMPESSPSPDGTGEKPDSGTQPPLLTEMIRKAGLSFNDIPYSQLILVAAAGAAADIYCYDRNDNGLWKLNEDTGYIKGHVGKNGVSYDKREGDGRTPAGLFDLGYAFGNGAKPETGMTWRAVTAMSYWVDDPNSVYYNQWVEGTDGADWDSAEKLSEVPEYYAYAVVVEYNTEDTVAGNGSAVFLHCKTVPTSGCIAAPQEDILRILKWLTEEKNPGILIVPE